DKIDLQKVIQELTDTELVYLIKGESEEIQNKIWGSMSEGRRQFVQEEMNVIGLIKKSEADRMTKEFVKIIREKADRGDIRIITDDEWVY
ncbi:MAG: hypothetical protein JXR64_10070, partial [Spirochaetales bacterium]|nr:hypothetical protein [Spirochaetales bacterium]